jgi:L-amino acid N-acyltransferase YncA
MAGGQDAAGVRGVYAPVVEATAVSFELEVPSVDDMAERITGRQPAYPWLVAADGDRVAGYAYAGCFAPRAAYAWSVEVSVYVADTARKRGVGRGLYTSLLAILGAQGYRRAMAGIALPNGASVGLHEAMGFSLVGVYEAVGWKLGAWHDVGWWQRALGDGRDPPGGPVPFSALGAGVVDEALAAGRAVLR